MKPKAALAAAVLISALISPCIQAADKAAAVKTGQGEKDRARLEKLLSEFEEYAARAMADWRVPGMAIAIVRGNDVIYQKAFGVKELGKADPVTTDTVFQIGSASKAFTSALIATLVDGGKIGWGDRVSERFPDFKMHDPWVTREFRITDLMAQRSGMSPHAIDSLVMTGFGRDRVINSLQYVKPSTSFRSAYAYQNNLWLVAARVAETITGDTWEDSIRRRILGPLGMSSSSTDMKSFAEGDDVAALHQEKDGKVIKLPMDWPYMDWTYVYGPAGGINSNIKDMAKWLMMQSNNGTINGKRIIKEESAKFMREPRTPIPATDGAYQYYCLGWVHREASPHPITWHNGGTSGSKTMVAFVPSGVSRPAVGIVVLSNLVETQLPESLAWRFFDMYFGNARRDWSGEALEAARKSAQKEDSEEPKAPVVPEPALALDRYTGDYKSDIYGTVAVEKSGEGLSMTVGPKKVRIEMRHWDGNRFVASWKYFTVTEEIGFVTFSVDSKGVVIDMVADVFNEDGCGTFRPAARPARDRLVIDGMNVKREKAPEKPDNSFIKIYEGSVPVNGVRPITYDQLQRLRASSEKFVLVDVLSSDDYSTGHIPGAISFPVKKINPYDAVNRIPMGANVVVYCLDFRCPYSDDAARKLAGYGYKVLAYRGGLDEWQQKGQKLDR